MHIAFKLKCLSRLKTAVYKRIGQTRVSLGGQLSVFNADSRLDELYGSLPLSGQVYIGIYPSSVR